MLQVQFLRDNRDEIIERLKIKNFNESLIINQVIELDDKRKSIQSESDELLARSNTISKEIGILFKSDKRDEANFLKEESLRIKEKTKKHFNLLFQKYKMK